MTTYQTSGWAVCPNCRRTGTGQYCSTCGVAYADGKANPYAFLADSFFGFGEAKQFISFFGKLLTSPTKNTIKAFHEGRLVDGVRFLRYMLGIQVLATAIAGFDTAMFGENELGKVIGESVQLFVMYVVWYSLYYFALRRKAAAPRNRNEFILFACITSGVTVPLGIVSFIPEIGVWLQLALVIPIWVYLVRAWKYFWGVSGKRVFWTLTACAGGGGLASVLVVLAVWAFVGIPGAQLAS